MPEKQLGQPHVDSEMEPERKSDKGEEASDTSSKVRKSAEVDLSKLPIPEQAELRRALGDFLEEFDDESPHREKNPEEGRVN